MVSESRRGRCFSKKKRVAGVEAREAQRPPRAGARRWQLGARRWARLGQGTVPPAGELPDQCGRRTALHPSTPFPSCPGVDARLGRGRAGRLRLAGTAPGAPGAAAPQLLGTAASLPAHGAALGRLAGAPALLLG